MGSKSKLKVWVMTNEFQPDIIGGLGIVATHLTKTLSQIGAKVTVLCPGNSNRMTISSPNDNLRILRFPKHSRYFNRATKSFIAEAVMRASTAAGCAKPDLIHVHSTEFADTAKMAGNRFNLPIVYSCHSLLSQGSPSPRVNNQVKLFRIARRIIVPSRWLADATKRRYSGIDGKKMAIIPHGVKPVSKHSNGAPNQLLYVGRLIPSKGVEPLIKAVALLSRDRKHVHLTVCGTGTTSYRKKLRALTRQAGVAKRIRWVNDYPHDAVQRMYASYGAVIVPSKTESFCLVALEAMANGVPLVSTVSGGLKEFVNSRNAQIIRSVDSVNIARAVKAFWNDPSRTKRRVINARSTAARYRWPAIARRYVSLFAGLQRR